MSLLEGTRHRIAGLALALLLVGPGCGRTGWMFARAALTVAAVATVLAVHDAHYHSARCGHEYVYYEDRPVYHYEGRWEYFDPDTGRWYEVRELPR